MAKKLSGKRPCGICRKWFQPDVRQKERQKTCGRPECMREQHRRQCENWNKKNKAYFKNDYLNKKIEKDGSQAASSHTEIKRQRKPVLPLEVIESEYGIPSAIIVQYLVGQIVNHMGGRAAGFT